VNLYLDIIDTENDQHVTSIEEAAKDLVALVYDGADLLDELLLVGSSIQFTIILPIAQNADAALIDLFTGDEARYKVELRTETEDLLIWNGFLLPDSYKEPYKNGNLPIALEATDGLGRLKGKYLPDDFYVSEHGVVDIVAELLKLTGLDMPIIFAPGIDNTELKNWRRIFLETLQFADGNKKDDAAAVLEKILTSLVSCIYQHLGHWYIEGLNKRTMQNYSAKLYNSAGVFQNNIDIEKVIRDLDNTFIANPTVTIIPPYGEITINTEQAVLAVPETLYQEQNDGWSPAIGVVEEIYATEWYHAGINGFYAKAAAPDYKVYLPTNEVDEPNNPLKIVQLLRRIYIKENTKLKLTFEFSIDYFGTENSTTIESLITSGDWTNPFDYFVFLGGNLLLTNTTSASTYTRELQFNGDKKATLVFEFIPTVSRLLNIQFRQPFLDISSTKIKGIFLENIALEQIDEQETLVFTEILPNEFTLTKEIDLPITDDAIGLSNAFRLFRLNAVSNNYNIIQVPILDDFVQNGKFYSVVALDGANLIKDNITEVYYNDALITVNDVVYNYNFGEQMVIETTSAITTGNFEVRQYLGINQDLNRDNWETWTDSVYELESKRLGDAVLGLYKRLFNEAYPMIEGTVKGVPILFNDLLRFNYIEETLFISTYFATNLDSGQTDLRMSKSNYLVANVLVPPLVDVGPDLLLEGTAEQVTINATTFDPDGVIVTYLWEQVSGDTTAVFNATDNPFVTISAMTGNNYRFRLTVTDNDGLTASDELDVSRIVNYNVFMTEIDSGDIDTTEERDAFKTYQISILPALPADQTIVFNSSYDLFTNLEGSNLTALAELTVVKNNNVLQVFSVADGEDETGDFNINYINDDVILIKIRVEVTRELAALNAEARVIYRLESGSVLDNPGIVTNTPIEQEIYRLI
jgi:hypothetical protein